LDAMAYNAYCDPGRQDDLARIASQIRDLT
jgi:hypothetical protein